MQYIVTNHLLVPVVDNLTQFDSMQAYDVADMFKQYLRELPDCLITSKLSETFLAVYQHIPQDLRLPAIQACVYLLPGKELRLHHAVVTEAIRNPLD